MFYINKKYRLKLKSINIMRSQNPVLVRKTVIGS